MKRCKMFSFQLKIGKFKLSQKWNEKSLLVILWKRKKKTYKLKLAGKLLNSIKKDGLFFSGKRKVIFAPENMRKVRNEIY